MIVTGRSFKDEIGVREEEPGGILPREKVRFEKKLAD